jgi:predicted RNA-binding Zn ribbon-like protein
MKQPFPKPGFDLISGSLCLDFANTVDQRSSENPEDKLTGYPELVAFGLQTGVFSVSEARRLEREGRKDPGAASRLFARAVGVREMIFRIMAAVANGSAASGEDVVALNVALQGLKARSLIAPGYGQGAWRYDEKNGGAGRLIGRIVHSAVEVLTSDDIERLKRCAAGTCSWLFLDRSRGRNRRWCEMRTCGSQHKARAYYRRKTASHKSSKPQEQKDASGLMACARTPAS